jgi:hypothetical protein
MPEMESPARSLKLPAGLDGPTRCRCRLGSQHEHGVRIAPEAKIASLRKPGLPQVWPYRLTPDCSGPVKVRRTGLDCKSDFQWQASRRLCKPTSSLAEAVTPGSTKVSSRQAVAVLVGARYRSSFNSM